MNNKHVGAWALFDFANSVYPAVMTTAVFPVFYVNVVIGDDGGLGELWWSRAVSLSALVVAVSAPLLGAVADRGGARKRFMLGYTAVCLIAVAMMSTLDQGMVVQGFLLFVVANIGFESALVFYNAYLPDIAPPEKQGWVSGLGFGVGYLGSALGLLMVIPFATDRIELVWLMVSGFFLMFALPAFVVLPKDAPTEMTIGQAARWGLTSFREIVGEVWALTDLRNFLLAFFFYIDGVLTIIVMAGVVATETFGFDQQGTIILFLIVQFSALIGAFSLAGPTEEGAERRPGAVDIGGHRRLLHPEPGAVLRHGGAGWSRTRVGAVGEPGFPVVADSGRQRGQDVRILCSVRKIVVGAGADALWLRDTVRRRKPASRLPGVDRAVPAGSRVAPAGARS